MELPTSNYGLTAGVLLQTGSLALPVPRDDHVLQQRKGHGWLWYQSLRFLSSMWMLPTKLSRYTAGKGRSIDGEDGNQEHRGFMGSWRISAFVLMLGPIRALAIISNPNFRSSLYYSLLFCE